MKKRLFAIALCVIISFSLVPLTFADASFEDIDGHWAKDAILNMVNKGIFVGESETAFAPDKSITRAEFVAALLRAISVDPAADIIGLASDVKSDDWFAGYVEAALSQPIIPPDLLLNGKFSPNQEITRQDIVVIVVNAIKMKTGSDLDAPGVLNKYFTDTNQISAYAFVPMRAAFDSGIIKGASKNTLNPKGNATRAEACMFIQRTLDVIAATMQNNVDEDVTHDLIVSRSEQKNDLIVNNNETKALMAELETSMSADFETLAGIMANWQSKSAADPNYKPDRLDEVEAIAAKMKAFATNHQSSEQTVAFLTLIQRGADSLNASVTSMKAGDIKGFSDDLKQSLKFLANLANMFSFRGVDYSG